MTIFCCCCGFLEVPWWNSLCLVLCARFFVFEHLLLLLRGFWRSPGGIPSVWFVSSPRGVCRPGSRTIKNRRGATGDQGGRWPTKTPLWSRENVPAVGPFVFVMLGPQKSLSASFVVDAKGSQGFLAVLSASEATRDKCVFVSFRLHLFLLSLQKNRGRKA